MPCDKSMIPFFTLREKNIHTYRTVSQWHKYQAEIKYMNSNKLSCYLETYWTEQNVFLKAHAPQYLWLNCEIFTETFHEESWPIPV